MKTHFQIDALEQKSNIPVVELVNGQIKRTACQLSWR